ncbi:MAG: O-antigen ligase family protein [Candidatus Scalindua rubra]|uniref:O-antigen ligase-related domain-containing protein n=1 Tax=Candidatus Scalindua brodae TaxID=237368 RepID=A0A0B0EE38_9BACT|nr:MAG: hypothetical protein SCABRO_03393 [Candidatus Scalindua brodae]MBZ0108442.1 O-antigen ligase family protein [Candidatus Scalindua rubra]TWU28802.1 O-Antigen ligase [Candidatus Brocadiaceae bacterium S225]
MGELVGGDFFDIIKLIVGVPLGIIMMVRGVSRIQELFLFFVFLIPLEVMLPTRLLPIPGMTVSNILLIELVILLYSKRERSSDSLFFSTSLGKPFFFIVVFNALLLLWGVVEFFSDFDYSFMDYFNYYKRAILTPFLIYIVSVNVFKKREDIEKAITIIVVGIVLVGLQAVMEHATGDSRIEGLMGQRNAEGAFFTMYFSLLLAILFGGIGKKLKIVICAAIALSCYGLVFTLSRGAMVSFPLAILFLSVFKYRRLLLPLSILCVLLIYVLPKTISERFNQTYDGPKASALEFGAGANINDNQELLENMDSSSVKRILIWKGALRAISGSPLFGIGFHRWPYVAYEHTGVAKLKSPHNMYLEIMLNSGIIGLLLFFWLFYSVFKTAYRVAGHCDDKLYEAICWGFMGCLVAFFPINMFGSHMLRYQETGYLWILIGMVMRLGIMTDKCRKENLYVKKYMLHH